MSDPVTVQVPLDLLKYINVTLRHCAEDLGVYIEAEYPAEQRAQYPTYERRYKNDREVVVDALYCLDQIKGLGIIEEGQGR